MKSARYSLCATLLATLTLSAPPVHAEDPAQYGSVEERRIQTSIVEERNNLHNEQKELELRKIELKTLEQGVDKKLAELDSRLAEMKDLQKKIEALLAVKKEEEIKKTKDLAKIYEKMSPDKAALAVSGLDKKLAADLLANMKVKAAAKILDEISRQKATELSTTFSTIQLE